MANSINLNRTAPQNKYPFFRQIQSLTKTRKAGASIVEFAIILPLFFALVFGIIEFGILMFNKAMLTNASRNAARLATLYKFPHKTVDEVEGGTLKVILEDDTEITIGNWIEQYCNNHLFSLVEGSSCSATITVSNNAGGSVDIVDSGEEIAVEITYPFKFLLLSYIFDDYTLKARSVMRAE